MPLVAAALALAVAVVVVGTQGADGPEPGEALVYVDGVAIVSRADGSSERVVDRTRLVPGDRLSMQSGSAELELNDDVRYSAVSAAGTRVATEIEMAKVPRLLSGPLLVAAPRDTVLRAGAGDIRLQGPTAARISRSLAARVDVFQGRAVLDTAGRVQGVPALRSAEVVAEGEITLTRPVSYRASDDWDRRYLGPAISLDREMSALASGLRANSIDPSVLAERLRTQLAGAPSPRRLRSLLSERDGALDAVLGLVVVGSGDEGAFMERWRNGFRFHDAGARWGLVAMDVGADPDSVIDALVAAVDGAPTGAPDLELAGASVGSDAGEGAADPLGGKDVATPGIDETGTSPGGSEASGPEAGGAEVTGPNDSGAPNSNSNGGGPSEGTPTGPGAAVPPVAGPLVTITPVTVPPVTLPVPVTVPVTVPTVPVATVPSVTIPRVTLPPATVPGVTLPPVTVPVIRPPIAGGVISGLGSTLGGTLEPITGSGGVLGPVTGSGGLLGSVTGQGGLLPLGP